MLGTSHPVIIDAAYLGGGHAFLIGYSELLVINPASL